MKHHEFLIRKSECERLHTIFNELVPSIEQGLVTKDVENLKEILEIHLPKLRDRAIRLASKCTKDSGCDDNCMYCNEEFVKDYFGIMMIEVQE